jgi:hypothetical protein
MYLFVKVSIDHDVENFRFLKPQLSLPSREFGTKVGGLPPLPPSALGGRNANACISPAPSAALFANTKKEGGAALVADALSFSCPQTIV